MFKSPQAFYDAVMGKSIDMDGAYGAQCWDLFDYFCNKEGVTCSRYCSLSGYAGDLYKLRYQYGYDKYFEFFYPKNAKRGDWYFSDRHVAMVWDVYSDGSVLLLGQNQGGKKWVTLKTYKLSDALGMMRWKGWISMNGWVSSNGKWYFYRDGDKLTGWQKLTWSGGEDWFFFTSSGAMVTGWRDITYKGAKHRFYFDQNGAMVTGLKEIGGKLYYFDEDGALFSGEKTLTLTFDSSGKMTGGVA